MLTGASLLTCLTLTQHGWVFTCPDKCGMKYLFIAKLQRCCRWCLEKDKQFQHTVNDWLNYWSTLGLKLNHVSKRGLRSLRYWITGGPTLQKRHMITMALKWPKIRKFSWLLIPATGEKHQLPELLTEVDSTDGRFPYKVMLRTSPCHDIIVRTETSQGDGCVDPTRVALDLIIKILLKKTHWYYHAQTSALLLPQYPMILLR